MKLTGRGEKIFFSQWISFFLLLSVGFNKYSVTIAGFSLRLYMAALLFGTAFAFLSVRQITPLLPFEKALFVFFLLYMLSCIRIENLEFGLTTIISCMLTVAFYFICRIYFGQLSLFTLERLISVSGIIVSVVSLITYILGFVHVNFNYRNIGRVSTAGVLFELGTPRLYGIVSFDPNVAAAVFLIFVCYYLFHLNGMTHKIGLCLSITCLMLTISRSGFIAFFLGIFVCIMVPYYERIIITVRRPGKSQRLLLIIGVTILIIPITFFCVRSNYIMLLLNRFRSLLTDHGTGRIDLWKYALQGWIKNPIWGIGGGYGPRYMAGLRNMDFNVHNTWIEVLLETGVIGFLGILIFIILLFKQCCNVSTYKYSNRFVMAVLVSVLFIMSTISLQRNEILYLVCAIIYRYSIETQSIQENGA
ncbi:MAG: O-antigen ligase family protein [Lachnospiraceae bacterium]|nr:O-antigen ligase family protein [Lachnospiraceae bacterium]